MIPLAKPRESRADLWKSPFPGYSLHGERRMDYRIPEKRYFRIGEVSALTQLEPHVIRYWEKEFPSLRPLRADSRQRLYSRATTSA